MGPKAPKDPEKKRKFFYIMRDREIAGAVVPEGGGIQYVYLNDGRLISSARIAGGVRDEAILGLLETTAGFRKLVYSIGVAVEGADREETVDFVLQMYGKTDPYKSGTELRMPVKANGMEYVLKLEEARWSEDDDIPGQIRFEFDRAGKQAEATVRFYLMDGFEAPEAEEEKPVSFDSPDYRRMLERSLVQTGNYARLKKAIEKAKRGEDTTIAFIGGSITQGAGAVPIHTSCYACRTFEGLCGMAGKSTEENVHYCKAGVGGTPSELGMIRYERDVLRDGKVTPDIVVVEFAVNDEGDETKGECYDSLVRKILSAQNRPAVILLFSVFADDWNLQERLFPVGYAYDLPMVSIRDAVVEQFYRKPGEGRVVSKNQFFYDCFHPSNVGHIIMADSLIHLFREVEALPDMEDIPDVGQITAPLGDAFWQVRLLDRGQNEIGAKIDCGDFAETDQELQAVEMDRNPEPTKEFPHNWKHRHRTGAPFVMDIVCTSLLLVYKDSGSAQAGTALVYVDGVQALCVNPRLVGWTHCNPLICFREKERIGHHVEIRMQPGDEEKEFTILGFGYVE